MSLLANYFYDNVFRWMMLDRMKKYTKKCFEQLMYIQKRIRDVASTSGSKVDVISNMWDKTMY